MERKVNDESNCFGDIMIMAMRYALGRRSFVTHQVPSFIMQNAQHIDGRIRAIMLSDLKKYFDSRGESFHDKQDDYVSWKILNDWLKKL